MRKSISGIIWAIAFLVFGVALILHATGVLPNLLFDGWWTIFLIVPGISLLFHRGGRLFGSLLFLFGLYFLLKAQNVIAFELSWPLILGVILVYIALGTLFHFNGSQGRAHHTHVHINTGATGANVEFTEDPEYTAIFSGVEARNVCKALKCVSASAIFGGVELDLTEAAPAGDIVMDFTAVFGGVNVKLPRNIRVKVNSTPIFGGVDQHMPNSDDPSLPLVSINATAVFGGVDLY